MHKGQHAVDAALVRALITDQMPDLAGLPLRRVGVAGTDNVIWRIGPDRVARFPRLPHAAAQIAREAAYLPRLARALPVAVPLAERIGVAGAGYPFAWSVGRWLPGRDAFAAPPEQFSAAETLARVLQALRDQPAPRDTALLGEPVRIGLRLQALERFTDLFDEVEADKPTLLRILKWCRAVPAFTGRPVWLHGDLHPLNLLTQRGRLTAVIDWGSMGFGDPAVDLMAGWTIFDAAAREDFREAVSPDPDAWDRGRALAFAKTVMAIPYYRTSNPGLRDVMKATLARIIEDCP